MKVLSEILLLEPGGEIRIGDGAPGVNFTGLRIYKTSSGYRFETYDNDVLQVYLDEHGSLVSNGLNAPWDTIVLGEKASLRSAAFISGMLGAGFCLKKDSNNKWALEIDNLRVRGSLSAKELLFQQVRATNGSIWVSSVGKVKNFIKRQPT